VARRDLFLSSIVVLATTFATTVAYGQVLPAPARLDSAQSIATLLNDAARVNALIPERLRAYRARIESEMSLVVLDSGGRERTAQGPAEGPPTITGLPRTLPAHTVDTRQRFRYRTADGRPIGWLRSGRTPRC